MIIHKANQAHSSGAGKTACGLSCYELAQKARKDRLSSYPFATPWKNVTCLSCLSKKPISKIKGKWATARKACLNCGSTFGNCSRCNRCNACHQNAFVEHSCAWRQRKKEKELKAQDPYRRTWTERQRDAQRDARSKRKFGE